MTAGPTTAIYKKLLTSILEPGQIFNSQSFRDFLKVNLKFIPPRCIRQ